MRMRIAAARKSAELAMSDIDPLCNDDCLALPHHMQNPELARHVKSFERRQVCRKLCLPNESRQVGKLMQTTNDCCRQHKT
jgi:starvation-inducible outer membrane lipoprotein